MKSNFTNILGMTIIVTAFLVEMIIYFNSSKDASNMAIQIISSCIALQGIVAGYFFVSSKQSANKDATILAQAQTAANTPSTTIKTDQPISAEVVNADKVETVNTQTVNDAGK